MIWVRLARRQERIDAPVQDQAAGSGGHHIQSPWNPARPRAVHSFHCTALAAPPISKQAGTPLGQSEEITWLVSYV